MNEPSVGNSTVDSDSFVIPTKDVERLETLILSYIAFYGFYVLVHMLLAVIDKSFRKKTREHKSPNFSYLTKLAFNAELTLIIFSVIFCVYYSVKNFISTSYGSWLWPPLALFFVEAKCFTEIQTIMVSLVPATTSLSHLTGTTWEWTEPVTFSVIGVVRYFVLIKEYAMIFWLTVTYFFMPEYTPQVIHFYFGLHLSLHFLLLLPIILQLAPGSKPISKMSTYEKMIISDAFFYFFFKLLCLVNLLYLAVTEGINHETLIASDILADIFVLFITLRLWPITVLMTEQCLRIARRTDSIIHEVKPGKF